MGPEFKVTVESHGSSLRDSCHDPEYNWHAWLNVLGILGYLWKASGKAV